MDVQICIRRHLKQTIWWYNTLYWWTLFHFQFTSLLTWNLPVSCDFSADLKLRILMDVWKYTWLQRSHISQYTIYKLTIQRGLHRKIINIMSDTILVWLACDKRNVLCLLSSQQNTWSCRLSNTGASPPVGL